MIVSTVFGQFEILVPDHSTARLQVLGKLPVLTIYERGIVFEPTCGK